MHSNYHGRGCHSEKWLFQKSFFIRNGKKLITTHIGCCSGQKKELFRTSYIFNLHVYACYSLWLSLFHSVNSDFDSYFHVYYLLL